MMELRRILAAEILDKIEIVMRFLSLTTIFGYYDYCYALFLSAIILLLALMMLAICSVYLQMSLTKALPCSIE